MTRCSLPGGWGEGGGRGAFHVRQGHARTSRWNLRGLGGGEGDVSGGGKRGEQQIGDEKGEGGMKEKGRRKYEVGR